MTGLKLKKSAEEQFHERYKYQIAFDEAKGNPAKMSQLLVEDDFDSTTFFTDYVEYKRAKLMTDSALWGEGAAKSGYYDLTSHLYDFGSALFFDHLNETHQSNDIFETAMFKIAKLVPESLKQYKNLAIQDLMSKGIFSEGYQDMLDSHLEEFDQYLEHYIKHSVSLTKLPRKHLWQEITEAVLGEAADDFDRFVFRQGDIIKSDISPLEMRRELAYEPIRQYILNEVEPIIRGLYEGRHSKLEVTHGMTELKQVSDLLESSFGLDIYSSFTPYISSGIIRTQDISDIERNLRGKLSGFFSNYKTPGSLLSIYRDAADLFSYARCC